MQKTASQIGDEVLEKVGLSLGRVSETANAAIGRGMTALTGKPYSVRGLGGKFHLHGERVLVPASDVGAMEATIEDVRKRAPRAYARLLQGQFVPEAYLTNPSATSQMRKLEGLV